MRFFKWLRQVLCIHDWKEIEPYRYGFYKCKKCQKENNMWSNR